MTLFYCKNKIKKIKILPLESRLFQKLNIILTSVDIQHGFRLTCVCWTIVAFSSSWGTPSLYGTAQKAVATKYPLRRNVPWKGQLHMKCQQCPVSIYECRKLGKGFTPIMDGKRWIHYKIVIFHIRVLHKNWRIILNIYLSVLTLCRPQEPIQIYTPGILWQI